MMTLWIPENLTTSQNIVFFLRGRQQVNGELTSVLWELLADLGHKLRDVHPCTVYMVGRGSHYICCCFNGTLSVRGKGQYVRDLRGSCSMVPFPFSFKIIVSHQRSAAAKAWIHYSPNTSFVSVLQFFWYPALFFPAFFFTPLCLSVWEVSTVISLHSEIHSSVEFSLPMRTSEMFIFVTMFLISNMSFWSFLSISISAYIFHWFLHVIYFFITALSMLISGFKKFVV